MQDNCEAFHEGTTEDLPIKTKILKRKPIKKYFLLEIIMDNIYLKTTRKIVERNVAISYEASVADNLLTQELGVKVETLEEPIFGLRHQFTHMTWNIKVYSVPTSINLGE